jgi:hypothetical protein
MSHSVANSTAVNGSELISSVTIERYIGRSWRLVGARGRSNVAVSPGSVKQP